MGWVERPLIRKHTVDDFEELCPTGDQGGFLVFTTRHLAVFAGWYHSPLKLFFLTHRHFARCGVVGLHSAAGKPLAAQTTNLGQRVLASAGARFSLYQSHKSVSGHVWQRGLLHTQIC